MKTHQFLIKTLTGVFTLLFCIGIFQTHAATITTAAGGTWGTGSTWIGGTVPGNGDIAVIANGHFVTMDATDTVAGLIVEASSFTVLTITAGDTLRVEGDVVLDGTSSSALNRISLNGILWVTGDIHLNGDGSTDRAHIEMSANSTLAIGGTFDFGGLTGKVTSASPSTIKYVGTTSQTVFFHANIAYVNLGSANTSSGGLLLGQNLGTGDISGDIIIDEGIFNTQGYTVTGNTGKNFTIDEGGIYQLNGTNAWPTGFTDNILAGGTVEFSSSSQTINMPNAGEYGNIILSGTGTKTLGENLSMNGNLTISTGITLDVSNGDNYSINIGGNWSNSGGTFTGRNGTVTFDGTGTQSISTNGDNFYNLTFNNVGGRIELNDDVTVSNNLTMTDGIVSTGANMLDLTNSSASALSGYSSASFVNGTLRRAIASNTDTYALPVGNDTLATGYFQADVVNNNMITTSTLTASFGTLSNHDDNDMSIVDTYIDYGTLNDAGVWTITPDAQPTGGNYNIRLYTANMTGLVDNEFGPLKRPEASTTAADWTDGGGNLNAGSGDGRMIADGYGYRLGLSSFSQFGMGEDGGGGSGLPIELISFTASLTNEEVVKLEWITSTEINNDFFTIEKSVDGVTFESIANIPGAGNSTTEKVYHLNDNTPEEGMNYYRLKQTDYDGSFIHSDVVAVKLVQQAEVTLQPTVNIYPNPLLKGNAVNVQFENTSSNFHHMEIYDAISGRLIYTKDLDSENINTVKMPQELGIGLYIVKIYSAEFVSNHKLLIQ